MQGTASDLIKRAMIKVQAALAAEQLSAQLVMQVHDELVLQVPEDELAHIKAQLPQWMSDVGEGVLAVPLLAEVGAGKNWDDAH